MLSRHSLKRTDGVTRPPSAVLCMQASIFVDAHTADEQILGILSETVYFILNFGESNGKSL